MRDLQAGNVGREKLNDMRCLYVACRMSMSSYARMSVRNMSTLKFLRDDIVRDETDVSSLGSVDMTAKLRTGVEIFGL